jgi:hypothetical protein
MNTELANSSQITLPKVEPCSSLQELRRKHSALLRSQRSERDSVNIEPVLEFISQIKATGRYLASEQSREMAVGFLDYWTGVLVSRRPDLSFSLGVLDLDPVDSAVLSQGSSPDDPEHETVAKMRLRAADSAVAFQNKLPVEQRECLRTLLFSLIKLNPSSQEVERAFLSRNDEILKDAKLLQLAEKSREAGVLISEGVEPNGGFVLAHDCLLEEWTTLKEICNLRKSIREMAGGWDKAGKPAEALLNGGEQLTNATDFTDLNSIEKAFIEQSRRRSEQNTRVLAGVGIILILVLLGVFSASYWKVASARNDLERANTELREINRRLQEEKKSVEYNAQQAEAAKELALNAAAEAAKINAALSNSLADYEKLQKNKNATPISPTEQIARREAVVKFNSSISNLNTKAYQQIAPRYSKK